MKRYNLDYYNVRFFSLTILLFLTLLHFFLSPLNLFLYKLKAMFNTTKIPTNYI